MENKKYSTNLTGAGFLFYEIKLVSKLLNEGLGEKDVKAKIVEENLFQYRKVSSVKRVLPTLFRRANLLGKELRNMLIGEDSSIGRLINLYGIMEEDLLFKEFMLEVIKEKYNRNNLFIELKDINSFFDQKGEENEDFVKYKEGTKNKLRQVFLKILVEAGILKDQNSGKLNRIFLDPYLVEILKENKGQYFIDIFK